MDSARRTDRRATAAHLLKQESRARPAWSMSSALSAFRIVFLHVLIRIVFRHQRSDATPSRYRHSIG
jgi:hypothetical protein